MRIPIRSKQYGGDGGGRRACVQPCAHSARTRPALPTRCTTAEVGRRGQPPERYINVHMRKMAAREAELQAAQRSARGAGSGAGASASGGRARPTADGVGGSTHRLGQGSGTISNKWMGWAAGDEAGPLGASGRKV